MAAEDYMPDDMGLEEELHFGHEEGGFGPRFNKTCNRCGTKNLRWGEYVTGWRLFYENGVLHECNGRPKQQAHPFAAAHQTPEPTFTLLQISNACRRLGLRSDVVHPLMEYLRNNAT